MIVILSACDAVIAILAVTDGACSPGIALQGVAFGSIP
jgi:hypothetical protein